MAVVLICGGCIRVCWFINNISDGRLLIMGKVSELEAENADLRNIIETKNVELEKQNSDLKIQLGQVIDKLDKILEENISLRTKNEELTKRIVTLETLLSENVIKECDESSEANSTITPCPDTTPFTPQPKQKHHALILSDSIMRHVVKDCPKNKKICRVRKKEFEPHPIEQDFFISTKKSISLLLPEKRC